MTAMQANAATQAGSDREPDADMTPPVHSRFWLIMSPAGPITRPEIGLAARSDLHEPPRNVFATDAGN